MSSALGSLVVKIGADISGLRGDVSKATSSLGSLEGSVSGVGRVIKGLAAAAAATGLAVMVRDQMEAIDTAAKLSRQLGGTINGLKGLQFAAADAGVDSGALDAALQKLNQRLGEAARTGAGPAHEALQRLGLSARELSAMDLDQRLAAISDAMREKGYTTSQTADALGQLGIRQGEVVRLMQEGGEAIRGARVELEAMGLAMSEVDAAKVEAANDAIDRVKLAASGLTQHLAVALSPAIQVVATKLVDLAKEGGGFREAVQTAVEVGVKGFGYLGNVAHGLHIALKAVEVAAWGIATALTEGFRVAAMGVTAGIDGMIGHVNLLIAGLNKFSGFELTPIALTQDGEFMQTLEQFAANMQATTKDAWDQLVALTKQELPSGKATKLFEEIEAAAQKAAVATVKAREAATTAALEGGGGSTEAEQAAEQKQREKLEQQLQTLREFAMTEEQLEIEKHARRLEQLNAALDAELLTLTEYHGITQGLEREHMAALEKIRGDGAERIQRIQSSLLDSLGMASQGLTKSLNTMAAQAHSNYMALAQSANAADRQRASDAERHARHMFDVSKGFAIADALVQGALGVAKTLGAYPYPENLLMAAPHAAAAAAQVATIAAQQFQGSGGTVSAPAGGAHARMSSGGSSPVGSAQGGAITGGVTQGVTINMGDGEFFSRKSVLGLIEGINEAIADGARITVN